MEDRIIHSMALRFADWLNNYAYKEGKDYLKVVYGTEVMIMNVTKLIVIFAMTLIMQTTVQTVAVLVGFNVIRRYAFGVHAKSSTSCTLYTTLLFVIVPYLLREFAISNLIVLPVFCVGIFLLFLFAPSDTESRPLVGKKNRARLRKKAALSGLFVMLAVLVIRDGNLKAMITLGAIYEIVSILPLTYKILDKKWHNYEKFEREDQSVGSYNC